MEILANISESLVTAVIVGLGAILGVIVGYKIKQAKNK